MKMGKYEFDFEKKSYIMGILNVTPDSFSDGGSYVNLDLALKQAEQMVKDGAAIVDIGGESTRPGYTRISDQEEIERVAPVIEAIRSRIDVAISLDTYKSEVAKAGIDAGVDMINDIWGLKGDEKMADLLAKHQIACCLMHNRKNPYLHSFQEDYFSDIEEILAIADKAGLSRERIVLDPGVGFAKTYEQNLWVIKELDQMKRWNLPILLGTSRKSVIGLTLDLPVNEREEGTIATTVYGRQKGASIFRVHDVKANYRALKMADAILNIEL
ncbi:MAG: dihydropteroate synthase [Eubacteriales bacterium]|nr:dihydropteroate synthase [Eubacteriales bacterium]